MKKTASQMGDGTFQPHGPALTWPIYYHVLFIYLFLKILI